MATAKKKASKKKASKKKASKKKASKKKASKKKASKKKASKKKASKKKASKKKASKKKASKKAPAVSSNWERVFRMSFASVYPMYVTKVEKKRRTRDDVDTVIRWLTGYTQRQLRSAIDDKQVDVETFFAKAPRLNPNRGLITGVVCGVRVEDIEHPMIRKVRYLDKLVDELARGKKMSSILRT